MSRFFKGFSNIFRKKRIEYLGRTGIIFTHDQIRYFIGSELLSSNDFDIEIYKDEIYRLENEKKHALGVVQALKVFDAVRNELEKTGMRVYVNT
jgi:hypothetical protein